MGYLDTAEPSCLLERGWETLTAAWGLWQPMTVAEVQKLLGPNLAGLKAEKENSPFRDWILRQRQDDLDSLGLRGGIPNGYLVLDLNVRGGLGGPAGWVGQGPSEVEGLSHRSLCRGPFWGLQPPWTCAHCDPSSAPGFDPELSWPARG